MDLSLALKAVYYRVNIGAAFMIMGKVQYSSLTVMEDNRGKIVYFFQQWIDKNAKVVVTNHSQIQSDDSTVCGLYCIMFLRNALTGNALEQFVDLFDLTNSYANDSYVFNFMSLAYS